MTLEEDSAVVEACSDGEEGEMMTVSSEVEASMVSKYSC